MSDIQGYAYIKSNATNIVTSGKLSDFQGKIIRVIEFAIDNGIMAVNNEATHMAMIEPDCIAKSFRCIEYADVLCPPDMTTIEQIMYFHKVMSRKGGYNWICKEMVIASSLHRGVLTDTVLFQKQ